MSTSTTVQRSFSGLSDHSHVTSASGKTSSSARSKHSHKRTVSAFSSIADLKAQQLELSSQNKNVKFKVGGNVECVMTAIPESPFAKGKAPAPTEADLKLLGFTETTVTPVKHSSIKKDELRDEEHKKSEVCDDRTEVSSELVDCELNEEIKELESAGQSNVLAHKHPDKLSEYDPSEGVVNPALNMGRASSRMKVKETVKRPLKKIATKIWWKVKPLLCKAKKLFKKKQPPRLDRSKGVLT